MKAKLLLEDGTIIEGDSIGSEKPSFGEIVFNTGMTGYQEVLTDPSYAGQIVIMTYPLIGNYGVNPEDTESSRPQAAGFIIKEYCETYSNWKADKNLSDYLKENDIFAISNVDTRMLTKKIRSQGTMNCLMTTEKITEDLQVAIKNFKFPTDIVSQVSRKNTIEIKGEGKKKIGLIDLGIKQGIVKQFQKLGCDVTIFPWDISSKEILDANLDAVLLSNGPGDPKTVKETIQTATELIGRLPLWGICLGHQILCLALGGNTYKLKFGHRGSNHPVINVGTNKVIVTSQNHGYSVCDNTMDKNTIITYRNINDETIEGFSHPVMNIHTVQFHPEAGPGPADANFLFKKWLGTLGEKTHA